MGFKFIERSKFINCRAVLAQDQMPVSNNSHLSKFQRLTVSTTS